MSDEHGKVQKITKIKKKRTEPEHTMFNNGLTILIIIVSHISGKIVPFLENMVANGSVLTILAVSFERYRVVCQPLKGIQENTRKIIKIVCVIWIISAIASMPAMFMATYRDSQYLDGTPIKVCRNTVREGWQKMYVVSVALFFFGLPCLLIFCLYFKICCVLKAARKENINLDDAHKYRDRKVLQFQVMNIITSIVFLFFICHLPFRVIGLWLAFEDMQKVVKLGLEAYYTILYFGRIMFYLNHAMNPIIYNFVSTKFRHAMRYMLIGKGHVGSFISSQRRPRKENSNPMRHRQSRALLVEAEPMTKNKESDCERSSSFSSDARKNRNEFFPMYAHIIQGSLDKSDSSGPKCELKIQLVDKELALNINYTRKNRLNNNYCSGDGCAR